MKLTERDREALAQVKEMLEETAASYTVVQLCRKSGLNAEKLKRGFKFVYGLPPHQYHIQYRIEKAKQLLLNPALNIDEVSYELGYTDASNFCTAFRKVTGVRPGEWRRKSLNKFENGPS